MTGTMSKNTRDLQVLVVDDDFRVAQIHADVVTATAGLQVQGTARTVAEARRMITAQAPDLLLADVYLPDGDGIDLVRAAGVDAVVLSAAAEPATVRRALSAGVHGYLVKPFTRQSLTERLERVVRFRRIVDTPHLLKQEEIDRALSLLHGSAQPASATAWATEQLVLAAVGDEERTATEVAELTGVSRATAQRRLATMASRGVVIVRLRYGQSGRPEHLYSKSGKAQW